ncbi:MAG: aldo/keto reductase [Chloroflexi bacterium]|nr:aldo/keto reductase [Chloroflexota bacterium]
MTLKWGILGTGSIAKHFAAGVQHSHKGVLAAVGSRSHESADKFGDQFGIERRHDSYEALLADPEVEAVYIAVPHTLHAEWSIKAAEAGKHVLCEKPLGLNTAEAMAIIEAARENDVFLMEAYMYRCHPQTQQLLDLISSGVIGNVKLINATFSFQMGYNENHRLMANDLGGGGILDVGGYPVSIARLIAGAQLGKPFANPIKVTGNGRLNPNTGADEYAIASLEFEGGILAQLATGVLLNQQNVVTIYGDKGNITVTSPWVPSRHGGTTDIVVQRNGGPRELHEVHTEDWIYGIEADAVATAVEEGQHEAASPAMSWADSLGNAQTLDRWRSAIGLVYEREKPGSHALKQTTSHRPLVYGRKAQGKMRFGEIHGVQKSMSRLILGVDNQPNIAYASVIFDDFFERGGNMFDTAFIYMGGMSEQLLGQWIENRGVRDQVVILDKGAHTPFCTPKDLDKQFTTSLERLRTDYVDMYAMHRDNPEVPVGEFIDVMNVHVRAGRMKIFGGSNWTMERFIAANDYALRTGQQGMSFLSNNFSLARMIEPPWAGCMSASTPEFRSWLTQSQTPLLPWSSQARGFFLPHVTSEFTGDPEVARCWFADDNFERKRRATELAEKHSVEVINIALAYVLAQPFPTFPLIGPRNIAETRSSMRALDVELSPEDVRWLNLES